MITGTNTSMTNISDVYYEELDDVDVNNMADFYFYYNHHTLSNQLREKYEQFEMDQIKLRNSILAKIINNGYIPKYPKVTSSLFGISPINNKAMIIVEY